MRRLYSAMVLLLLAIVGCSQVNKPVQQSSSTSGKACRWSVCFSPDGGCTDAIVDAINPARRTILVQAYSFTSSKIARALLRAKDRGVDVRVILDGNVTSHQYSPADFFANSGIDVKLDYAHALAHNKVMIVDGETVITGSFNFTKAAETKNAENVLIVQDRELAARYAENWRKHEAHSEAYSGRGD